MFGWERVMTRILKVCCSDDGRLSISGKGLPVFSSQELMFGILAIVLETWCEKREGSP